MRSLISNCVHLLLGILFWFSSGLAQWTATSGPYGGNILTILPRGERIFVGAEGGGIFYSTNDGDDWTRSTIGIRVGHVNRLAEQGNRILAATDFGVVISEDEGGTWMQAAAEVPLAKATVIGPIGRFVLVGIEGYGLYRVPEGSNQWEHVDTLGTKEVVRAMIAVDSLLILGGRSGCYVSADSGMSWTLQPESPKNARTFAFRDGTLLVGTRSSLLRSTNRGATWVPANSGLEPGAVLALIVNGRSFYAGTENGTYQSLDDGRSWNRINNGLKELLTNALANFGDLILAGTEGSFYRTTDGGAFWKQLNNGLAASRVKGLTATSGYVFAGTKASGVFRTSTGGEQWTPINNELPVRRISSLVFTAEKILAGTLGGGVLWTSDLGETWRTAMGNTSNLNVNVLYGNGSVVYAGADSGMYYSDDQGVTWKQMGLNDKNIRSLTAKGAYIFAGTDTSGLFRTSNGGGDWDVLFPTAEKDVGIASLGVKGGNLFAGTASKGIFRSPDDGENWTEVNVGMPDTSVSAILPVGDRLFIATLGHGAYVSTNDGVSWEPWDEGLQNPELISLFLVGDTIYGGTTGWGVEIRHVPPPEPELIAPEDAASHLSVPVQLSWSPETGAVSYDLQLSLDDSFSTLVVDQSGINGAGFEMDEIACNTTYHWRVRGSGAGGKGSFSESRTFSTTPLASYVAEVIHPFPNAPSSSTDYRLISIPGVSPVTFAEVMEGVHETDWNVFHDTGVESDDHLVGIHPDSLFGTGRGYWAVAKGTLTFSDSIEMPRLGSDGTFGIALQEGWNIIGNPFDRPVQADAIRAANGDATLNFYSYQGTETFVDTSTLHPFEGYYVKNTNSWKELKIPYPFPVPQFAPLPSPPIDWAIQIVLETIDGVDRLNYAGIAPGALQGTDRMDKTKPVAIGASPYLTFAGEDGSNQVIGTDLRAELGGGQIWSFDIVNAADKDIGLQFVHGADFPDGLRAVLLHVDSNTRVDALVDSIRTFRASRRVTKFKLIVGPGSFVESALEETIPAEFALSQNYPNPFNPETAFDLDVPRESDVKLIVYSMLGEEIDQIASGHHAAGRYTYTWKGANHTGSSVASGVYFVRCVIDGNPMFLRKMILLR